MTYLNKPIQVLLRNKLRWTAVSILLATSFAAAYLALIRVRNEQIRNDQLVSNTVVEMLHKPLQISNTGEIEHVLNAINNDVNYFAVVTKHNDYILSDYVLLSLFKDSVDKLLNSEECSRLQNHQTTYLDKKWLISCSKIFDVDEVTTDRKLMGYLLSARQETDLNIFIVQFLFLLSLFSSILILSFFLFRRAVSGLIVEPLDHLVSDIQKFEKSNHTDISWSVRDKIQVPLEIKEISTAFDSLLKALRLHTENEKKNEMNLAMIQIASQISHDIRSPLAALRAVKDSSLTTLSSDQNRLLANSIDRITDIANTILPKKSEMRNIVEIENCFIWSLVDQIVSEKRVQHQDKSDLSIHFSYEGSVFSLNAMCNSTEFMRSISNIIDNAIEAKILEKQLNIKLKIMECEKTVVVSISDNGKGISQENVARVVEQGFTHGKINGSGLGLYQVEKAMQKVGGKLIVTSELNIGTTVTIELRKSDCPPWLVKDLQIENQEEIILLDDEEYVFQIIKDKFKSYGKPMNYLKFTNDFRNKVKTMPNQKSIFFVDHDLKQDISGLDLIRELNIEDNSILLTGNYDDVRVQQESSKLGVKILPKSLIHEVLVIS